MSARTGCVISVAGFDPCAGAGVLADVKTFESLDVKGFGVATSITYQVEDEFFGLDWIPSEQVIRQLDPLLSRYDVDVVKIGLIEITETLPAVLSLCNRYGVPVIWDPVISSSTGFDFHNEEVVRLCHDYFNKVFLITPNLSEIMQLTGNSDAYSAASELSRETHVFLKGGHSESDADDVLFMYGSSYVFKSDRFPGTKHGTGCVLSSAIACGYAKTMDLQLACESAKRYISQFILSVDGLLGEHNSIRI